MSRAISLHKKDVAINKKELKKILNNKGLSYIELYDKVVNAYGEDSIDLTYKGFMSLLGNRVSWKLLYAVAIIDVLDINIKDVFEIIDIDINKKLKDKKEWKKKYQQDK